MTIELFPQGYFLRSAIESFTACIHLRFPQKQHSMGIPVGAAVCCHDPVKVFGELTAIIGEDFH